MNDRHQNGYITLNINVILVLFCGGTDGSIDTGILKMNPVSLPIFVVNASKTVTDHFLIRA